MGFKTKLDYSNNRQIKQHLETLTALSGGTSFGLPFADLTKGPNTETSGETESYTFVASTFSGNNTTTIYNWYDARMAIGEPYLSALTPITSAETQTVLPVFQPSASIVIDGNVVNTAFTGVTFDITGLIMLDLGGGNYSGTVESANFDVLSANTAEYTGRTIWVDSSGITRTERLIITNGPQVGYVLTCIDTEGMGEWAPAGTGPVPFDVFVTGGTYSSGTAVFTNNTGGTFNVTGFKTSDLVVTGGTYNSGTGVATFTNNTGGTFNVSGFSTGGSGGTQYWSAGTGTDAIATLNGGNIASGIMSIATGYLTIASGITSFASGSQTIAGGAGSTASGGQSQAMDNYTHAEGFRTKALWQYSHAEGRDTITNGEAAHAEGNSTQAIGNYSHSEGYFTKAIGWQSHAQGSNTIASADTSHAGGNYTTANGYCSLVHGSDSIVNGNYSIVLGRNITGNTADTTYVDFLNIKNVPAGTSINNLGIDATGKVVIGSGGGGGSSYWSASTGTNAIGVINFGGTASGNYGITMGWQSLASGAMSLAQNSGTTATGDASYAEGAFTIASGQASHAEGAYTIAGGFYATHAEGLHTFASGEAAHAEGTSTVASGHASHAEGAGTKAIGTFTHSEGYQTIASGDSSHAEGSYTIANGDESHAGGSGSTANGITSFVHGHNSTVNGNYSIVLGRNLIGNTADTTYVDGLNINTIGTGPGTIDLGVNAGGFVVNQASDERLKENINTIEGALDKVLNLRGVTYNWRDRINGGDDLRIGFIAQEVQEVEPLLVTNNGDYLGVQYKDVPALLVEAIKELVNGKTEFSNTYLETQTIQAEDNNIELNVNGTLESSVDGGMRILRGEEEPTSLVLDADGNWVSNVNILSKGFVIPEYTPTSSKDSNGVVGNIVQDDNYIYIKRNSGWKRTPKLEDF